MSNVLEEEKKLRIFIKGYLEDAQKKKFGQDKIIFKEERVLRVAIRKLLQEKESVVPGASTGINELESVLVSIVPAIESDYKKLTTSSEQRKSYRAHIIRAAIDVLLAADASFSADEERERDLSPDRIPKSVEETLPEEAIDSLKEQKEEDEEIKINIDDSPKVDNPKVDNPKVDNPKGDESKLIDIETSSTSEDKTKTNEEPELESFTIPGQDLTGRNVALRTWNKRGIGTTIKNGYKLLEHPKDRKIFFDYLLTNLKLYFDRFEKDLQGTVTEPTTSAYEKIKLTGQSYEAGPKEEPLAEGKRRKRLVESKKLSDQIINYLLK